MGKQPFLVLVLVLVIVIVIVLVIGSPPQILDNDYEHE
jgi:hypothetical protein